VMPIVSAKFVVRREMKPRFFPCPLVTEALIELIFAAVLRSSPLHRFPGFPGFLRSFLGVATRPVLAAATFLFCALRPGPDFSALHHLLPFIFVPFRPAGSTRSGRRSVLGVVFEVCLDTRFRFTCTA